MSARAKQDRAEQVLLSDLALGAFRLNGQFLEVAEDLSRPAGLTAAWWQVLGAALPRPLSVADIARTMGITRQSVQRIANLLVEKGLAEYQPNPAHRRAKLVASTEQGFEAIAKINPAHSAFAGRLAQAMDPAELADALAAIHRLSAALESLAD